MLKMKKLSVIALLVGSVVSTASFAAEDKITDTKFIDDSSYAVGVLMGKNLQDLMKSQESIISYDQARVLAGVEDALKNSLKLSDDELGKQLQALDAKLAEINKIKADKLAAESKATGDKFRAEYETQAGVKKTTSGLLYKIEKAGEGDSPKVTDIVKVHYKGTLPDGTVFDSSYDRKEPVEFQLSQLIPAWIEAIPMLKKGGKMELVAKPELAYGDHNVGKIPASSTLKFEIELLDFKSPEAAAAEMKKSEKK